MGQLVSTGEARNLTSSCNNTLHSSFVTECANSVNTKLSELARETENFAFNLFDALDFRMLSGMVGELFIRQVAHNTVDYRENPNIDGYPDLCATLSANQVKDFEVWRTRDLRQFIKYPHGGFEIKNTFGVKPTHQSLLPGQQRIYKINAKPDWKAHHRETNNLIAIQSDFIDQIPQIVAIYFSNNLHESDWSVKRNPKPGSAMTSFTVIEHSGWSKLKKNCICVRHETAYKQFAGI